MAKGEKKVLRLALYKLDRLLADTGFALMPFVRNSPAGHGDPTSVRHRCGECTLEWEDDDSVGNPLCEDCDQLDGSSWIRVLPDAFREWCRHLAPDVVFEDETVGDQLFTNARVPGARRLLGYYEHSAGMALVFPY